MALKYKDRAHDKTPKPAISTNVKNLHSSTSPLNRSPLEKSPDKAESPLGSKPTVLFNPLSGKVPEKKTEIKNPPIFDPLGPKVFEKKPEPVKVIEKKPEPIKPIEVPVQNIEPNTIAIVHNENSLVEKCNAALLLLLEQSDE